MSLQEQSPQKLPEIFQAHIDSREEFTFSQIAEQAGIQPSTVVSYFLTNIRPQWTWAEIPQNKQGEEKRYIPSEDTLIIKTKCPSPKRIHKEESLKPVLDPRDKQGIGIVTHNPWKRNH